MGLSTVDAFKHIRSGQDGIIELDDEQLHALQETLRGMLRDVDECCRRHGLQYMLGGGSCLGAVRHHGFIPWDDDIDINMPRADHDRFTGLFREEYGDRYWIHTPEETAGYGLTFTRVLLRGTSVRTREDFHNEECGAFIDIFVIENTPENGLLRGLHGFGCMTLGFIQSCSKFRRDRRELMALAGAIGEKERQRMQRIFRTKIILGYFTAFRSTDAWTRAADRMYSFCSRTGKKGGEDRAGADTYSGAAGSTWVTIPSGRGHYWRELYRRSTLLPPGDADFDGGQRMIPADAETYLRRMYGEYMTPPPEGQRERHLFYAPFSLGKTGERTQDVR